MYCYRLDLDCAFVLAFNDNLTVLCAFHYHDAGNVSSSFLDLPVTLVRYYGVVTKEAKEYQRFGHYKKPF